MNDELFKFLESQKVVFLVKDWNEYVVLINGKIANVNWSYQDYAFGDIIGPYDSNPDVIFLMSPNYNYKNSFFNLFEEYYPFEV